MESSLKNMVLTLFIITLVASGVLGLVYSVTEEPIQVAQQAKTTAALAEVLPAFDNNPAEGKMETEEAVIYTATNGGEVVGYAVETSTQKGFSGEIRMMVGFKPDGEIYNIQVLQHSETPGLGSKMTEPGNKLIVSFVGKNPADLKMSVKKDGGDIDALTASTISSRAYVDAVQRAYNAMQQMLGKSVIDSVSGATSTGDWEEENQKGGNHE